MYPSNADCTKSATSVNTSFWDAEGAKTRSKENVCGSPPSLVGSSLRPIASGRHSTGVCASSPSPAPSPSMASIGRTREKTRTLPLSSCTLLCSLRRADSLSNTWPSSSSMRACSRDSFSRCALLSCMACASRSRSAASFASFSSWEESLPGTGRVRGGEGVGGVTSDAVGAGAGAKKRAPAPDTALQRLHLRPQLLHLSLPLLQVLQRLFDAGWGQGRGKGRGGKRVRPQLSCDGGRRNCPAAPPHPAAPSPPPPRASSPPPAAPAAAACPPPPPRVLRRAAPAPPSPGPSAPTSPSSGPPPPARGPPSRRGRHPAPPARGRRRGDAA